MRRSALVSGGIVAGALVIGAASPALAAGASQVGNAVASAVCVGTGPTGTGPVGTGTATGGYGGPARGTSATTSSGRYGAGTTSRGTGLSALPQGTLTEAQQASLQGMAEEEKLAHDVYVALAAKYPSSPVFARIASAETQHLATVRLLLTRYQLSDPTAGKAAGQFSSAAIQQLYDQFSSAATVTAAYADGQAIEKDDLAKLAAAGAGVTAPDVVQAYKSLTAASQQHLTAFGG